jgi:hypothetical protein
MSSAVRRSFWCTTTVRARARRMQKKKLVSSGMEGTKKGAVNFQRRTWDKSEYEDRAKERADKEALGEDDLDILPDGRKAPAPYRAAPEGLKRVAGSERAYVQARTDELHLDAKLHKKQASGRE